MTKSTRSVVHKSILVEAMKINSEKKRFTKKKLISRRIFT